MASKTVYAVVSELVYGHDTFCAIKCKKCGLEAFKIKLFDTREAAEQYKFEMYGDETVDGKECCEDCPLFCDTWIVDLPIN